MINQESLFILGTRPEIIKTYPLINKLKADVLFTGQHYNKRMSDYFFNLIENSEIHKVNKNYKKMSHNEITDNLKQK